MAAVPYFPAKPLANSEMHQPVEGPEDELNGGGEGNLDLDRLHSVGVAARVLQLLRRTEVGGAGGLHAGCSLGWAAALACCRLRKPHDRSLHAVAANCLRALPGARCSCLHACQCGRAICKAPWRTPHTPGPRRAAAGR